MRTRSTTPVCTRLTIEQVRALDVVRGGMSRSAWIEKLVQAEIISLLHDRSYPNARAGDFHRPGYIGAIVDSLPPRSFRGQVQTDPMSAQVARLPGADDGDDAEAYIPQTRTVAVQDRKPKDANGRTAKPQKQKHSHLYDVTVAQVNGRHLSRCACGALTGWVPDSTP